MYKKWNLLLLTIPKRIKSYQNKLILFMLFPFCIILYLGVIYNTLKKGMKKMENQTERKDYVFENVDNLVEYLFSKFGELSPLKLQKGLYFLYAYYGATYGEANQEDGESEQDYNFPKRLFKDNFEAWTYGPVIRTVYNNNKEGKYGSAEKTEDISEVNDIPEVRLFIDELFGQINSVSDFSLVDRSHEDISWQNAYNDGKSTLIDNDALVREYKEDYVV